MSQWAYVHGAIVVSPMGRTQPEKRYILDTVLDHLPRVTGSEGDMEVYVVQPDGHNSSSSCDEFGKRTNNLTNMYGVKTYRNGWLEVQRNYILVLHASLRDRNFSETKTAFLKWLCRLAKRISVEEVLVSVESDDGSILIQDNQEKFWTMFEDPSWYCSKADGGNPPHVPNWCEYLMWDRAKNSDLPVELCYKYYEDPENDAEYLRRFAYENRQRVIKTI